MKVKTLADLRPDPRNARRHTPRNVGMIEQALREVGAARSIVIDETGTVLAGNATIEAAAAAGIEKVRVVETDGNEIVAVKRTGLSPMQKTRLALFDNRAAELAEWEVDVLRDLEPESLDGLFREDELKDILDGTAGEGDPGAGIDDTYTAKIVSPVYEPKGECPPIAELADREKTARLIEEIDAANLPKPVAAFLRLAAERHTAFHFRKIAEFYCHATPEVQDLMERSGLVIIDFKKAIEYGFVHMTERLGQLADLEEAEAEDDDA